MAPSLLIFREQVFVFKILEIEILEIETGKMGRLCVIEFTFTI